MPAERGCELSIVVPTRNEAPNVAPLAAGIRSALAGLPWAWELIFVDDSDDETPAAVRALPSTETAKVLLLHREPGGRSGGLGGAVQAGFAQARGRVIAVMDGDLQHPPGVLPELMAPALSGQADLVAGSRYGARGSTGGLAGPWRRAVSWGCRWLAHRAVPGSRALEDPLSGLFALRRSVLEGADLRPDGYKILLEVAARGRWDRAANVAYTFAERQAGDSKASLREGMVFFRHLAKLALRPRPAPARAVVEALASVVAPAKAS